MLYRVLKNPTKVDIVDYPIEEYQMGEDGEVLVDLENQSPIGTGVTKTWSLAGGETLRFPKYVADILMDRFGFLEETFRNIKTDAESEIAPEIEISDGTIKCPVCEKSLMNIKALGMHMGSKHPEELMKVKPEETPNGEHSE
jgi:hypothetical protein